MTARSLTAGKDNAHVEWRKFLLLTFNELDNWHAIGIREQSLNFFLVANRLSWSTFLSLYWSEESFRQFWLISSTSNLQITFFHVVSFFIFEF